MSLPTPISYFGGKTRLRGWILPYLEDGNTVYVEPFCGSGNILFAKPPHPVEVINDLDDLVVNFFRVLQNRRLFRHFAHRVRWTPFASEEFRRAVEIIETPVVGLSLDHAWAFFVRGTQGFGGNGSSIGNWRRTLTVSGGIANTANNWRSRMAKLELWRDRLLMVQVDHRPALDVIQFYDSHDTTFYIDPPYVEDTRKSLNVYAHEMTDSDHAKLIDLLLRVKGRVVLSGYHSAIYDPLVTHGWTRLDKDVNSSMGTSRGIAQTRRIEVLWINREGHPSLFGEPATSLSPASPEPETGEGPPPDVPGRPIEPELEIPAVPAVSVPAVPVPAVPAVSVPAVPVPAVPEPRGSVLDWATETTPEPVVEPVVEPSVISDSALADVAVGRAETPVSEGAVARESLTDDGAGSHEPTPSSDVPVRPRPIVLCPGEDARDGGPPVGLFGDELPIVQFAPATKPLQSLSAFLDEPVPVREDAWQPHDPPDLTGIDHLIINVETNGLKWYEGDRPIGITIGTPDGQLARFLPFGFRGQNLDEAVVQRWAERELRGKHIENANTRFDIHMLRAWGVDLVEQGNTFGDVQHYAALCDDHRKRFSLDVLAEELLGGVTVPRVDESRMSDYEAQEVAARAEYQVELVARLRDEFWPRMDAEGLQKVRAIEDGIIPVVVEMEQHAALIDRPLLAEMTAQATAEYHALLVQISTECGFNFDDSPQAWERLFQKYDLPITRLKNEKKSATFKDEVIARIDHPLVKTARYAAQLDSLRSKIFHPYTEMVGEDGLLRFQLHQLRSEEGGAVSGRFSAPYVQQVPNHDNHSPIFGDKYFPRRLYLAAPGMLYFAGDAAQIEYRIFAHLAKNPKVLEAYRKDPDASFHKMIAPMLQKFKADLAYTGVKSLNFMTIYGGSLIKTAVMMGFISEAEGDDIKAAKTQWSDDRMKDARDIATIYDRELPEVKPMLALAMHLAMPECDNYCNKSAQSKKLHQQYQHRGFVMTLLGRRQRFPTHYKIHKALNSIIQGTAADLMKLALIEVFKNRKSLGLTMRLTVHDELCGDVPNVESAARIGEMLNEQRVPLTVPIRWSVGTGANWAEAK